MKKINFTVEINTPAQKVWQVLWSDMTYRKWASVFMEGSYAVSDWNEGSKIQSLTLNGEGMYGIITENRKFEFMAIKHIGVIKNFEEQPNDEEASKWNGFMETYSLKEINGKTTLIANMDTYEEYLDYFDEWFPKALALIKELSEKPMMITIETLVNAPVEKVWAVWTTPEHITKWNTASEDWHTPYAENDLRVGGKFVSRMEARDGSFGFEFGGKYDEVKTNELIASTLDDGRKMIVNFSKEGDSTRIVESFEAENENSFDLQQFGWQSILNNFKKYTETFTHTRKKEHV